MSRSMSRLAEGLPGRVPPADEAPPGKAGRRGVERVTPSLWSSDEESEDIRRIDSLRGSLGGGGGGIAAGIAAAGGFARESGGKGASLANGTGRQLDGNEAVDVNGGSMDRDRSRMYVSDDSSTDSDPNLTDEDLEGNTLTAAAGAAEADEADSTCASDAARASGKTDDPGLDGGGTPAMVAQFDAPRKRGGAGALTISVEHSESLAPASAPETTPVSPGPAGKRTRRSANARKAATRSSRRRKQSAPSKASPSGTGAGKSLGRSGSSKRSQGRRRRQRQRKQQSRDQLQRDSDVTDSGSASGYDGSTPESASASATSGDDHCSSDELFGVGDSAAGIDSQPTEAQHASMDVACDTEDGPSGPAVPQDETSAWRAYQSWPPPQMMMMQDSDRTPDTVETTSSRISKDVKSVAKAGKSSIVDPEVRIAVEQLVEFIVCTEDTSWTLEGGHTPRLDKAASDAQSALPTSAEELPVVREVVQPADAHSHAVKISTESSHNEREHHRYSHLDTEGSSATGCLGSAPTVVADDCDRQTGGDAFEDDPYFARRFRELRSYEAQVPVKPYCMCFHGQGRSDRGARGAMLAAERDHVERRRLAQLFPVRRSACIGTAPRACRSQQSALHVLWCLVVNNLTCALCHCCSHRGTTQKFCSSTVMTPVVWMATAAGILPPDARLEP